MYYKSVGGNATLALGLTPDARGLLPAADVRRLKAFGQGISKRFEDPLGHAAGNGTRHTITFKVPEKVNQITIGENIRQGERIRRYQVQAKLNGGWITVCKGTSVGQKRIQPFSPVITRKVRLIIDAHIAAPRVQAFNAYYLPGIDL